jgi:hypothetical protein
MPRQGSQPLIGQKTLAVNGASPDGHPSQRQLLLRVNSNLLSRLQREWFLLIALLRAAIRLPLTAAIS